MHLTAGGDSIDYYYDDANEKKLAKEAMRAVIDGIVREAERRSGRHTRHGEWAEADGEFKILVDAGIKRLVGFLVDVAMKEPERPVKQAYTGLLPGCPDPPSGTRDVSREELRESVLGYCRGVSRQMAEAGIERTENAEG